MAVPRLVGVCSDKLIERSSSLGVGNVGTMLRAGVDGIEIVAIEKRGQRHFQNSVDGMT